MKGEDFERPLTCLPEIMVLLDEIRRTKIDEEERFEKRVAAAAKELNERNQWKFRFLYAALVVLITVACAFGPGLIGLAVRSAVNEKFDGYTNRLIERRVQELSWKTLESLEGSAKRAENLAAGVDLLKDWSLAIGGDASAYEKIVDMAQSNETARAYLNTADAVFGMFIHRKGHDSCLNEVNWNYRKDDRTEAEKIRLINANPGVNKETLNLLIGLIADDYGNAKRYTGLLVRKAGECSNLMDRIQVIDCIHAMFDTCPKSPDLNKLQKWWAENRKPEYEAVK